MHSLGDYTFPLLHIQVHLESAGNKEAPRTGRRLQEYKSAKQAFTERRTSASKQIGKVRFGYNQKTSQGFK